MPHARPRALPAARAKTRAGRYIPTLMRSSADGVAHTPWNYIARLRLPSRAQPPMPNGRQACAWIAMGIGLRPGSLGQPIH